MSTKPKQYIIVKVAKSFFAINIASINSIIENTRAAKVPHQPPWIEGVIDVRGDLITLVSLRRFLNIEGVAAKDSRILIVTQENRKTGFLVDDAAEVMTIPEDSIGSMNELWGKKDNNYIKGIATVDKRLVIILDLCHINYA